MLDRLVLVAVGLVVVQLSTATMWWTAASGIPLLVADALLAIALLDGALAERVVTGVRADSVDAGSARVGRTAFGTLASVGWILAVAACVRCATADANGSSGAGPDGCGSALHPTNYDCVPITHTAATTYLAVIALVFGGMVMSLLRTGRRLMCSQRVARWAMIVGVVLILAAIGVVPRSRPTAATQALELATVTKRVYVGVALLMLGLTVLCTLALTRRGDRFELPVLAALAGLVNAAVAGLSIVTIWIAVLADYMMGP